jgi:hypothetical protein
MKRQQSRHIKFTYLEEQLWAPLLSPYELYKQILLVRLSLFSAVLHSHSTIHGKLYGRREVQFNNIFFKVMIQAILEITSTWEDVTKRS